MSAPGWPALVLAAAWALSGGPAKESPPLNVMGLAGFPVELTYRAFQPGEVILAAVSAADPTVKRLELRFMGQSRTFRPGPAAGPATALLGIDVQASPRVYPLEIVVERRDGTTAAEKRDITVEPRDFPTTRLAVAPAMVAPPPAEAVRIAREAELVAAVLAAVSPDWLAEGPFVSPLPDYEPFPNFGQRRVYNRATRSVHSGTDIAAPGGTAVRAANSGRVALAASLYFSGQTVIIDHGRGVFTYYCHFSRLLVKRGDAVRKGQVIARVGSTGRSTGPHLHFSARILDSRVDPFSLVGFPLEDGSPRRPAG